MEPVDSGGRLEGHCSWSLVIQDLTHWNAVGSRRCQSLRLRDVREIGHQLICDLLGMLHLIFQPVLEVLRLPVEVSVVVIGDDDG